MTKIICLSDTHGLHNDIIKYQSIPDGDVLVHTGDFQSYGKDIELVEFNRWLGTLPHKYKIVIAGNHDRSAYFRSKEETQAVFTNAIYLQDEGVVIHNIHLYGSPWSPTFFDWYFMLDRGSKEMEKYRRMIPKDTDVLLTHSPPMGKLDFSTFSYTPAGCEQLKDRVDKIKPKYHIFGHMHLHNGIIKDKHTTYINASICDDSYKSINKIHTFEI